MAIRVSTPHGFALGPPHGDAHTVTAPVQTARNAFAKKRRVTCEHPVKIPSLLGLVQRIITTYYEETFYTLSKKEQVNSIMGILRTLQGGQISFESAATLDGRICVPRGKEGERSLFTFIYEMLQNGFNGLSYTSKTALADLDHKKTAKVFRRIILGENTEADDAYVAAHIKGDEATEYTVADSVTSSLLRCAKDISCARAMRLAAPDAEPRTICYAGRPDTEDKLRELIYMMIRTEIEEGRLHPDTAKDNDGNIPFSFVINSLISTLSKQDLHVRGETTEYELLQDELRLIRKMAGNTMEIDNVNYRLDPTFFCGNFNFVNGVERAVPESLSGKMRARLISDNVNAFAKLLTPDQLANPLIATCIRKLVSDNLTSEEELLLRFIICKEAGIPQVIHCRSCVDRTTIAAAMIYALNMWTDLGHHIPVDDPLSLLDTEGFKELFWDHIAHAIEISAYSRKEGGFKWHTGPFKWYTQHPTVLRLMPPRLLQSFNFFDLSVREQAQLIFSRYAIMLPFHILKSAFLKITQAGDNTRKENLQLLYRIPAGLVAGVLALALMTILFLVGLFGGTYIAIKDALSKRTKDGYDPLPAKDPRINPIKDIIAQRESFLPIRLAIGLAYLPFTLLPERIIRKGLFIQRADGAPVPVVFGDRPLPPGLIIDV